MLPRVGSIGLGRSSTHCRPAFLPDFLTTSKSCQKPHPHCLSASFTHAHSHTHTHFLFRGWQSNSKLIQSRLRWKKSITVGECSARFMTKQMLTEREQLIGWNMAAKEHLIEILFKCPCWNVWLWRSSKSPISRDVFLVFSAAAWNDKIVLSPHRDSARKLASASTYTYLHSVNHFKSLGGKSVIVTVPACGLMSG